MTTENPIIGTITVSAPSEDLRAQLDERTRQVAQLQDDLCDARHARDKAQAELAALKAEAKQAPDSERVTVYAKHLEDGNVAGALYSEAERRDLLLQPGQRWLAIEARVVREGQNQ